MSGFITNSGGKDKEKICWGGVFLGKILLPEEKRRPGRGSLVVLPTPKPTLSSCLWTSFHRDVMPGAAAVILSTGRRRPGE